MIQTANRAFSPRAASGAAASLPFLLAVALSGGCGPPGVERSDEIARFQDRLRQQARACDFDRPLTLSACEELAIANSLDLSVRRLGLRLQDDQVRLALAGGLPKASALYGQTVRSKRALAEAGGVETEMEERHQKFLAVQAVAPALDFGLTYYSWQIALDRRRQERLLVARAQQLLRRDVRVAYARCAGAIRQERLSALACQAAGQVLRVARSLERARMTVRADTALIEAALAEADLQLALARNRVSETRLALAQLMSLPPGAAFDIIDELPPCPPAPSEQQLAAYVDRALRARPELAVQDLQRRISASAVAKEASAFFPQLDLTGSFNWSGAAVLVNPAFFLGGFQVTHSLLDGGRALWRGGQAKKTVALERERSLLLALGVLYDVRLRALRVLQAQAAVAAARTLETARREALNRIVSLYKEGLEDEAGAARSLADLTIQATALDQALTEYQAAWYELEAAVLPEDSPTARAATQPSSQSGSRPALLPPLPPGLSPELPKGIQP